MKFKLQKTDDKLKEKFASLSTPEDVAELLEVPYRVLNYYLYILPVHDQYKVFDIAKKSKGKRTIYAPITPIKILQKKLNYILQLVFKTNMSAHGFVHNRSVLTNAKRHLKNEYVFNIDLLDFFPSISYARVYGVFKSRPCMFPDKVASRLASLCCYRPSKNEMGFLPQGAPTSPVISNIICWRMDNQLFKLSKNHQCKYSRYADDITFSTNQKEFPKEVAVVNSIYSKRILDVSVGDDLKDVITKNGFSINSGKVWIRHKSSRQQVTGLTVNQFPNLTRKYTHQIRAMLYDWEMNGSLEAEKRFLKRDKKGRSPSEEGSLFKNVVKGKINYLKMIRGDQNPTYQKLSEKYANLTSSSFIKIIRDFDHDIVPEAVFVVENKEEIQRGTAFMLYPYGIITSAHVMENDQLDTFLYKIDKPDDKRRAIVKYIDKEYDIAVLEPINKFSNYGFVKGDSDLLKIKDIVTVIGFPSHIEGKTIRVQDGKITRKSWFRYDKNSKQVPIINVSADILHGNSGGPVVNHENKVIGIAFWGAENSEDARNVESGIMPIENIFKVLPSDFAAG